MRELKKYAIAFRFLVFALLLYFVTIHVYAALSWKDTDGIIGLYRSESYVEPDVIFLGSSHSFCTINTAQLWEEYGIAAEDYGENGQTFISSRYYLTEVLRKHHPKIVFVELRGINFGVGLSNGNLYRNTINLRWSGNYIANLKYTIGYVRKILTATSNLDSVGKGILMKFPIVHTRYGELSESDFVSGSTQLRYRPNWSQQSYPIPEACGEIGVSKLNLEEIAALDEMATLAQEYDFNLVLWVAPYIGTKDDMKKYNAVKQYAQEHEIGFYNFFDLLEETEFNFSTDMRKERLSGSHMNSHGAEKITAFFGMMLDEEYDLPDRRGDPKYSRFGFMDMEWKISLSAHRMATVKTLEEYISGIDPQLIDITIIVRNPDCAPGLEGLPDFDFVENDVPGLYTSVARSSVNGIWELSDRVKLSLGKDGVGEYTIYDGTEPVEIGTNDIFVVAVSKINGKLINTAEFVLSDGGYIKT